MPPVRRLYQSDMDELAWDRNDRLLEQWEDKIMDQSQWRGIANFIHKYCPGEAEQLHIPVKGGYNVLFRLEYEDGSSAALRMPDAGVNRPHDNFVFPFQVTNNTYGGVRHSDEKVRYEVATMKYVAAHTTIPVPKIFHWGTADENPLGYGPFIIMEYINHERTMSVALNDPSLDVTVRHHLDPNISDEKLRSSYSQMADVVLQLSTLTFQHIGSLEEDKDGNISPSGRPWTSNMNAILDITDTPASLLPQTTFSTTHDWYTSMADMHLIQYTFQHNNAIESEDEARDKYVARQLFRNLAAERRLTDEQADSHSFTLFSEDLRPSNVLVDKDDKIVGVIDWEWTYSAPAQFTRDPPWWLLLKVPLDFDGGWAEYIKEYTPRLETFLSVLEEAEAKTRFCKTLDNAMENLQVCKEGAKPLSQHMRESWENKTWMIQYASRNSWAFDFLFWRYLDAQFFGEHGANEAADHHARVSLLSEAQEEAMEEFIAFKVAQDKEKILVDWSDEDAGAQLAKVLV